MQKKKFKIYNPKLKEECGVFGISNFDDASALTALGLHALQHRGQEGCGIVTFDGKNYYSEKRFGLVGDNFNKEKILNKLKGNYAIGHNRYSTTGGTALRNVQPFYADTNAGGIGVSHNGNLTNAITLRRKLVEEGAIFYTTSDTETIVQLVAKSKRKTIIDKVIDALFHTRRLCISYVGSKYINWCKRYSRNKTFGNRKIKKFICFCIRNMCVGYYWSKIYKRGLEWSNSLY